MSERGKGDWWVIRETGPTGQQLYFQSHDCWHWSPEKAAVFREQKAAQEELARAREHGVVYRGSKLEVVDLIRAATKHDEARGYRGGP